MTRRLESVFNLQGGELIIIGLVALVVLGPEKLPDAARRIGRMYAQMKRMGDGFVDEFRQAVDEPVVELRRQAEDITSTMKDGVTGLTSSAVDGEFTQADEPIEPSAEEPS